MATPGHVQTPRVAERGPGPVRHTRPHSSLYRVLENEETAQLGRERQALEGTRTLAHPDSPVQTGLSEARGALPPTRPWRP